MTSEEFDRYRFFYRLCHRMIALAMLDAVNNPVCTAGKMCNCQTKRVRVGNNSYATKDIRDCAMRWLMSDDTEVVKDILGLELTQVPFLVACDIVGEDPKWVRRTVQGRIKEGRRYGDDVGKLLRNEHIDDAIRARRYTERQLGEIFGVHISTVRIRANSLGIKTLPAVEGGNLVLQLRHSIWKKYPGAQIPGSDIMGVNKECTKRILGRVRRHNGKAIKEARARAKRREAVPGCYTRRRNVHRISMYQGGTGSERKVAEGRGLHQAREESTGQRTGERKRG